MSSKKNPIPIVRDLPPKERNLWTGIIVVIALGGLPFLLDAVMSTATPDTVDLIYFTFLAVEAMLTIMFLMHTKPTNPKMFIKRRGQFVKLLIATIGFALLGFIGIIVIIPRIDPMISGTGLLDMWFLGVLLFSLLTLVWYFITMWNRNPAAIFFPNPFFLIQKHNQSPRKRTARSHKEMKRKLGR